MKTARYFLGCTGARSGAFVLGLMVVSIARGAIDFETVPGVGTPTEGMAITTQYQASQGMSFQMLGGAAPLMIESGNPSGQYWAFLSPYGDGENVPAPGQNVGSYFITDPATVTNVPFSPLVVTYSAPVRGASGVVLDVDSPEVYMITAFDAGNVAIDSLQLTSASPNAGDAMAAPWSFLHASADIASVQIASVYGGGVAYDNFATVEVPEPASLSLLAFGGAALLRRRPREKAVA
jgi:hypothetical protein